jgi:hypothetical protein
VLGGEWAIFGDGGVGGSAAISIEIDLTEIASVTVEQFFVDGSEDGLGLDLRTEGLRTVFPHPFGVVESGNPSLRVAGVSELLRDVALVRIRWNRTFLPEDLFPSIPPIVGFIDNITFHPVPEPSSWLLLSLGIGGVVMIRRKLASRA